MKKLLVAVDYDGTWASAPKLFTNLGKSLMKAGHKVVVLTGNANAHKALADDGYKKAYDEIEIVDGSDQQEIATAKAKWLKDHNADLLIDNNGTNVSAASQVTNAAQFVPKSK